MAKTAKGIYYPGNYESVADVPEDMKKMAESIEQVIENEAYDDTQIKKENIELKAENERLREDLNNTVPGVPGVGENITLKGTANARFKKFEIGGNSWQETRSGKNVYKAYKKDCYLNSSGIEIGSAEGYEVSDFIEVNNINSIYFYGIGLNDDTSKTWANRICLYDENKNFINMISGINESSIKSWSQTNVKYIRIGYVSSVTDKMIVLDNVPTPYEKYGAMPSPEFESPIRNVSGNANVKITNGLEDTDTTYQEQSFTFPLAEGQKLMLGDYLADDGIHHKKNQIELDGTEAYITQAQGKDNIFYTAFKNDDMEEKSSLICSHFKNIKNVNIDVGIDSSYKNYVYIGVDIETIGATADMTIVQKTEKWKTYLSNQKLAGTPVVIEYYLAEEEEEIEAYTEDQQAVYNQIKKKAKSYGDTTHIFSEDEISPIFNVEANADIQTMFNNLQAQILAGEV